MRTTHWRSQATVDPYAECEREPFENPFTSDDPPHKKYENRTVYRPYTRKTDWMNLTRLRRGLSRGAAAGCSQGREPLETVINDHKAPEGRQVLCVPVAPPGLLAAAGPTTRGSRPWLHSIVPTGLAQTSQFRQHNKFLLDQDSD